MSKMNSEPYVAAEGDDLNAIALHHLRGAIAADKELTPVWKAALETDLKNGIPNALPSVLQLWRDDAAEA